MHLEVDNSRWMGIYGSIAGRYTTDPNTSQEMGNSMPSTPKSTGLTPQVLPRSAAAKDNLLWNSGTNRFYVYLHLKGSDGSVFYVGKGSGTRAWERGGRNRWWHRTVRKHDFLVVIYRHSLPETCAFSLERMMIRAIKDGLCNMTFGGEGQSGLVHTEESRRKMSASRMGEKNHFYGKTHSPEVRERMSAAKKGRPGPKLSAEARAKISDANRGRVMSDEARAKMSAAWIGREITPEWRANLSKAQKGRKHSPEHVKNQADAQRGKKLSEEHKAAIGNFHRGKKLSEEHKAVFSHPVLCSNGMRFPSTAEAARWLRSNGFPKASGTNIRYNVSGTTKSAYGFTWSRI